MFFDNELMKEYRELKEKKCNLIKLYCIDCVNNSLEWLKKEDTTTDAEKLEIASAIYDNWLDTDIQISKISDILCEYWKKYCNDENFNIYDAIDGLYDEDEEEAATDED